MSNVPPANLRGAVDLTALVQRATARTAPAPAAAEGEGGAVFSASDATFPRVLELSSTVPVVVEIVAPGLPAALGPIVESYGGRLALAVVDGAANPQIAAAFQVREVPAVAAVIGGRPVQLFLGIPSEPEVRSVFDELLALAAQNGVTGTVPVDGETAPEGELEEPPLPPLHQEAFDAISRRDYAAAIAAYEKALRENPRDADAVAGKAQAALLQRLDGAVAMDVRAAAAARPQDVDAQLAVADLDVSGGHLEDAFARLLDLFPGLDAAGKQAVRTRLLDYFEIAGAEDPRVIAARRALTNLLY